jgi:hypothetical protein
MKKYLLLLGVLFYTGISSAQQSLDLGFAGGITNYFGDLGNDEFYQASSLRPGIAVTLRNFISPNEVTGMKYSAFNIEARLSWHRIGYDETKSLEGKSGGELRNYGRGLSFRNDLYGFSTHVSYTYYPNRRLPLYRQSVALFVFTGIGVFYGRPKADLFNGDIDINNRYYFWSDGTIRDGDESTAKGNIIEKDGKFETDLIDWHNEGQGVTNDAKPNHKMYSPWNIGFPIGGGFRYGISKAITFSIEFGYYKFLTDYLDDVSDAYATYKQIEQRYPNDKEKQEIAKYISDPTGKGTNGEVGPATSRRGNPKLKDSYSFINMEVAYKINWNPKKLTAMFSKRDF